MAIGATVGVGRALVVMEQTPGEDEKEDGNKDNSFGWERP